MACASSVTEPACDTSSFEESLSLPNPSKASNESQQQKQKQSRRHGRGTGRRQQSFATYFRRVLKHLHVGLSLSREAVSVLESLVKDMFESIVTEASFLCRRSQRSTLRARDLHTAVHLLLPGQLAKQATSEGKRAVIRCRRSHL